MGSVQAASTDAPQRSTSIGPYESEKVDSYELGLRSTLLDGRLVFNATMFHSEYQDKHESEIYQFGAATETVVNNAAQATIDGLEIEAQFLAIELVQLRLTAGMIDGAYEEFLAPDRIACQGITRAGCPEGRPFRRLRFWFSARLERECGHVSAAAIARRMG